MSTHDSDPLSNWDHWINQHGWKLLAHARQFCRLTHDAEDLVQNVIAELWNCGGAVHPPDFPVALARIRQRSIDLVRAERSRVRRESKWQTEEIGDTFELPAFPSDMQHDRHRVQDALDQLPLIFREVISLKLWSDLTFEEIAQLLSLSKNTAASRYRLALEKLRPLLSPTE